MDRQRNIHPGRVGLLGFLVMASLLLVALALSGCGRPRDVEPFAIPPQPALAAVATATMPMLPTPAATAATLHPNAGSNDHRRRGRRLPPGDPGGGPLAAHAGDHRRSDDQRGGGLR